ncbi:hypothetical protein SB8_03520 [Pseudomonas oryzihabitans]|nr:hypothetical protein SB8_03520 [Pseudomonas psychrotolerans]
MRDERFYFSDHSIDRGWEDYAVRVKRLLEDHMTHALGFAVREAAYYLGNTLEQLQGRMRPVDHDVLRKFLEAHALTLSEVLHAFRVPSRVDGWKA